MSRTRRRRRAAAGVLAGLGVAGVVLTTAGVGHQEVVPTASANEATVAATANIEVVPPAQPVTQEVIAQQAAAAGAAIFEAIRPHAVLPVAGRLTSGFGQRWGTLHAGIDFGDPIGAPIHSVTDGVVIEAGPASGFGLWVRVAQDDGTIGVYGHVNEILATVGQHVRAGDVIATVGNRGFSTGPHLHYEVWLPGNVKIDPLPWLAARGVTIPGLAAS